MHTDITEGRLASSIDDVIVTEIRGSESDLASLIGSVIGGNETVPDDVRGGLIRLHRAAQSVPDLTLFVADHGQHKSPLDRIRPSLPTGAGVAVIQRGAVDALLGSISQTSSAPGSSALVALARSHGFDAVVQPVDSTDPQTAQFISQLPESGSGDTSDLDRRVKDIKRHYKDDQTQWAKRYPGFGGQAPAAGSSYAGSQELHALSKSVRFHRWMAEMLRPAIGHDVLEVGAGIGTMTLALAAAYPSSSITSIEPDPALYPQLAQRVQGTGVTTATQSTLELDPTQAFDTLLYVNVLEHIEDHGGELKRAHSLLRPGGKIGIIVPAIPGLYGSLDAKTGHYRRYRKQALASLVEQAGFEVTDLHYFDTVGVLPYWASIKLGSMPALSDRTTMLFDNVLVPMSKLVHRTWKSVPIGKNLLLVAVRR